MSTSHNLTLPAILFSCLALGACQASEQNAGPDTGQETLSPENLVLPPNDLVLPPNDLALPDGTVQTGKNTFMIPLDEIDSDGCQGYRMHAPGRLVAQVIYYREASGKFTVNKMDAACHAPEQL